MQDAAQEVPDVATIREVESLGQSMWLDAIHRGLIRGGDLGRLISEGLRGVTANPSTFEKAIAETDDYAEAIREATGLPSATAVYEAIAIRDVQDAADLLRPVHDATAGRDGFVSLEVAPRLARDVEATVEEAKRLWRAVGRDNLMIKVPGTPEGVRAVEVLTEGGLNVNVTLLFSRRAHQAAARAFIAGLEKRVARGEKVSRVASVASFFVSRVDTAVDGLIAERLPHASRGTREVLRGLSGRVAVANAKLAYAQARHIFAGPTWRTLEEKGARPQRVLWASTGTKNPAYRDVKYLEELIGPDTVTTVPQATLDAFRDHGRATASLARGLEDAVGVIGDLEHVGLSLEDVTAKLLADGIRQFDAAMAKLLAVLEKARPSRVRERARAG
jgi:transaldolase/glucose-6-phosphate isomerase